MSASRTATPATGPLWMELTGFPGLEGWRAGFTTRRAGGELSGVLPLLGWEGLPVVRLAQRHGSRVVNILSLEEASRPLQEADGLTTACRGLVLTVASADCVPLVLFDPDRPAGAVIHAGWRGTRSRIVRGGVEALRRSFGCRPEGLRAMIGPAIGHCCYRVGREVVEAFLSAGFSPDVVLREDGDGAFLDLPEANRRDLVDSGLDPSRIHSVGLCTRCLAGLFPSYRRDGSGTGRILTFLGSSPHS